MPFVFNPFTNNLDIADTFIVPPGEIIHLTGNSGGAVSPTAGNINLVGDGTTINAVGNPGTSTITFSSLVPVFTWNVVSTDTAMVAFNGYLVDSSAPATILMSLPASGTLGDTIKIGKLSGAGVVQIVVGAGQAITLGNIQSFGPTGTVTATELGSTVELVYYATNSWYVDNSMGNWQLA